jgi:hypothetical protein
LTHVSPFSLLPNDVYRRPLSILDRIYGRDDEACLMPRLASLSTLRTPLYCFHIYACCLLPPSCPATSEADQLLAEA